MPVRDCAPCTSRFPHSVIRTTPDQALRSTARTEPAQSVRVINKRASTTSAQAGSPGTGLDEILERCVLTQPESSLQDLSTVVSVHKLAIGAALT
eukprot:3824379-Prymnesium_polylepis.3